MRMGAYWRFRQAFYDPLQTLPCLSSMAFFHDQQHWPSEQPLVGRCKAPDLNHRWMAIVGSSLRKAKKWRWFSALTGNHLDPETWSHSPEATQLLAGRTKEETQVVWSPAQSSFHSPTLRDRIRNQEPDKSCRCCYPHLKHIFKNEKLWKWAFPLTLLHREFCHCTICCKDQV